MKIVVNEPQVVESYPYGRLRTQATFSVEFNKGKGFRSVFQTIDPKTGRINNPKKGIYYPIMLMEVDDNGFVKHSGFSLTSDEGFTKAMKFMEEYCYLFTDDQVEFIALRSMAYLKASMIGSVQYGGCNFDDIKGYYKQAISKFAEIAKTGHNLFDEVWIDHQAIESHKPQDFNPFVTTTHKMFSTV